MDDDNNGEVRPPWARGILADSLSKSARSCLSSDVECACVSESERMAVFMRGCCTHRSGRFQDVGRGRERQRETERQRRQRERETAQVELEGFKALEAVKKMHWTEEQVLLFPPPPAPSPALLWKRSATVPGGGLDTGHGFGLLALPSFPCAVARLAPRSVPCARGGASESYGPEVARRGTQARCVGFSCLVALALQQAP
jgi:hypothetical protein